jgi:hypothetical protein
MLPETKKPAPLATVVVIGAGFGASAVQRTKWAHTRQIGLLLFTINEVICRALIITIAKKYIPTASGASNTNISFYAAACLPLWG